MQLFYCDESNLEEHAGDFLIYGGLVIDSDMAHPLSAEIDALRAAHRLDPQFPLKFNPGPQGVSHQEFIDLKSGMLGLAAKFEAGLIAYVVLHDIAGNADQARRNGINTVCFCFDCLLSRRKQSGLVLIDRFNDQGNQIDAHLVEKFSVGVTGLPYSKKKRLQNILGFHYSAIGQSHFPSLTDVVIGSLRFAINAHTRGKDEHLGTASKLLKMIAPLFITDRAGGPVSEIGFTFSPKVVKAEAYRKRYESLKEFLAANGVETVQAIAAERWY